MRPACVSVGTVSVCSLPATPTYISVPISSMISDPKCQTAHVVFHTPKRTDFARQERVGIQGYPPATSGQRAASEPQQPDVPAAARLGRRRRRQLRPSVQRRRGRHALPPRFPHRLDFVAPARFFHFVDTQGKVIIIVGTPAASGL